MNDYIDRQAAIDALGERPVVWDEWTDEYTLGQRKQYDYDKLAIEALPSAEVVPVKRGKWINITGDEDSPRQCSVCLQDFSYIDGLCYLVCGQHLPMYCPNCGAKMYLKEEVN